MGLYEGIGLAACGIVFALILEKLFACRHAWTLVVDREFKSPLESLKELDPAYFAGTSNKYPKWSFKRVYVAVLKCDKCGGVKELRQEIE